MNNTKRNRTTVVCLAALVLLAAGPATAQVIQQGIDALATANGTTAAVNLPAGFFCPGSPALSTSVNLTGSPLTTNPPGIIGNADTIVERLKDAYVPPGGCATTPVVVRSTSMVSTTSLTIPCADGTVNTWRVSACTCGCCGVQPITEVTICDDGTGCGCGTFRGELRLDICLTFTNEKGVSLGPVQDQVTLFVNTPWCANNPGGVLEAKEPFMVDTNCDAQADLAVPCTTNFFPGATCGGPSCPPDQCHEGPSPDHMHCVNPVCDPRG